jgi:hypothetical protein
MGIGMLEEYREPSYGYLFWAKVDLEKGGDVLESPVVRESPHPGIRSPLSNPASAY